MRKRLFEFFGILLMLFSVILLTSCDTLSDNNTNGTKASDSSDSGSVATTKYTVKFETNGGSSVSSQRVEKDNNITQPTDPTKTGNTFVGWYSDSDLSEEFDFNSPISSNITIYAKWDINTYEVSFDSDGGTEIDSQIINYGEKVTKPINPEKEGFTFVGWYADSSLTTRYSFNNLISDDTIIYAKWNINKYTVKFETSGGSIVSSQKVEYEKTVTKPAEPTKTGNTFVGWYIDSSLSREFDFDTLIVENTIIYAKWDINTYEVSFNSNGGTEIDSQIINYGEKVTKPTDPEKEGYTFDGWYTSSYFITSYDFTKAVTKDLKLYAKWTEIPKVVKYEVGTPLIYLWTNSIDTRWMKIAVPVTNTGEADLYIKSCTADIETKSGQLLQSVSYVGCNPEWLKPGETGYYYKETTCDFTETDVKVSFNVAVEKAVADIIRYDVSDVTISDDTYGGIKIIGRVTNNTKETAKLAEVVINMFDSDGKLICSSSTYIRNDIAPGGKDSFSMSSYAFKDISASDVASYEIYAYPNQYNW